MFYVPVISLQMKQLAALLHGGFTFMHSNIHQLVIKYVLINYL